MKSRSAAVVNAMRKPQTNMVTELALLALLSGLWGAQYTFIRIAVETIPPVTLVAVRVLIAAGIFLIIIRQCRLALPRNVKTWSSFLFQACMTTIVPSTLLSWARNMSIVDLPGS